MARKTRHSLFDLPPLELECMKALWALGEATVEDIRARLLPARPLAYTTVMTVMDRLARKGVAQRRKQGRAHLYSSAVAEESVREHALERLVENFFDGSRRQLREHLAGASPRAFKVPVRPPRPAAAGSKARTSSRTRKANKPTRVGKPERTAPPAENIDPALL